METRIQGGCFVRAEGVDYSVQITPIKLLSGIEIDEALKNGATTEDIEGTRCLVVEYDSGILYREHKLEARNEAYEGFRRDPQKRVKIERVAGFPIL